MSVQKKVAILQSNYIPWKGYFDIIAMVDEFIFLDEVQFTKNDWRNRNKIKGPSGPVWLTIPVRHESLSQKIQDTQIASRNWSKKHWNAISLYYSRAKAFNEYKDIFESLYKGITTNYLSEVNYIFIATICNILQIKTKLNWSNNFNLSPERSERLVDLCKQAKATHYLTGPSAKNYLNHELFEQENIELEFMNYGAYPEYSQLYGPFIHEVSIIDLIFNEGPDAINYMKSFEKLNMPKLRLVKS